MAEPLHRQLLSQARRLARLDPKRPQQGNLRCALSSAFYALFHYFADQIIRAALGTAHERRPYRDVLARALEHGEMARACKPFAGGNLPASIQGRLPASFAVPPPIRQMALTFQLAQELRHLADYDRAEQFARGDVLSLIQDVEQTMAAFDPIKTGLEARFFLLCLLTWSRLEKRR